MQAFSSLDPFAIPLLLTLLYVTSIVFAAGFLGVAAHGHAFTHELVVDMASVAWLRYSNARPHKPALVLGAMQVLLIGAIIAIEIQRASLPVLTLLSVSFLSALAPLLGGRSLIGPLARELASWSRADESPSWLSAQKRMLRLCRWRDLLRAFSFVALGLAAFPRIVQVPSL